MFRRLENAMQVSLWKVAGALLLAALPSAGLFMDLSLPKAAQQVQQPSPPKVRSREEREKTLQAMVEMENLDLQLKATSLEVQVKAGAMSGAEARATMLLEATRLRDQRMRMLQQASSD